MKAVRTMKLLIAGLALAGLAGCAGMSNYEKPQLMLVDPSSVPKEKWSDALVMFTDQMGIPSMQDTTVDSSHGASGGLIGVSQSVNGVDMGLISGSLGAGAAFSLLASGPSKPMLVAQQIAFWVPADQAANAAEASQIVAEQWAEVRRNVLQGRREVKVEDVAITAYPFGHPKWYGSVQEELNNVRPPFEGEARLQTVGTTEGMFYGPIFVERGQSRATDQAGSKLSKREMLDAYSQFLPTTAMLYEPGFNVEKGYLPAFIIWNGQKYFFQSKP